MITGSVLSRFSELELSTADDKQFHLTNNLITRLALRCIGLPHLGFRRRAGIILSEIKKIPGSDLKILDAGCGYGLYSMTLARAKKGIITAVDLDAGRVRALQKLLQEDPEIGGRIDAQAASITRLPFADNSYDVIVCSEVIEHIPDHENAVRELSRVLKPGGTLMLSVPHDSAYNRLTYTRFAHERPGYSRQMLQDMFSAHGVTIEKQFYYEYDPVGVRLFNFFNSINWKPLMGLLFYPVYALYLLDSKIGAGEPCYIVIRATKSPSHQK